MIVGIYFILIFTIGYIYKVDLYNSFTTGIKKGLKDVYNLIAPLIALHILIKLIMNCGILDVISSIFININPMILIECILKPFSYSGSLVVLTNIIKSNESNYFILLGSMILFSTDTTFFVVSTYLNDIRKINYSKLIKCCIVMNIFGIIYSIIFSKIFSTFI